MLIKVDVGFKDSFKGAPAGGMGMEGARDDKGRID